ncbi:MAG: DUF58 domain-containing protein [Candidatus Sungiibacteriota bacterium]
MKKNQELIRFRKLARSILPGHFLSTGVDPAGLEFQGLREYEPGESTETIDWNASGMTYPREVLMRLGERRRNIMLAFAVDATRSMEHRRELISNIWEALWEETSDAGHQAACLFIGGAVKEIVRPNVGGARLERLSDELRNTPFSEGHTDLSRTFEFLLKRYRTLSQVAVIVSDFLFPADYAESLMRFRAYGNEAAFLILHEGKEADLGLPAWSFVGVKDSETGAEALVTKACSREEVLGSHIALLSECGAGWAVLDDSGARDEALEEKLRQAFSYKKERKEAG